ncbi:hypothetical protein POM88_015578 [Heracleum sosnowskyi]|uniref:Uncharacterized protein n=1 Tax=Heracleum sosnowskyi TaxID=360622 RepID=A0AAD8IP01_9APIA|nr:hypothetical protein POM88_015578 [Heracleum sosnowskyi]
MDEEQPKSNNPGTDDSEIVRRFVQKKIFEYVMVRGQRQPIQLPEKTVLDLTKLVDKALFNSASTLDKYMDMDTLEKRLMNFLRHLRVGMKNQRLLHQQQQMNSSGNISMIITTFDF